RVATAAITRWLKGCTARAANRILNRTGLPFWQDESYDHYLRSPNQMNRTIVYIEKNPVSAGLVDSIENWRWSSAVWQAKPPAPPKQTKIEIRCKVRVKARSIPILALYSKRKT